MRFISTITEVFDRAGPAAGLMAGNVLALLTAAILGYGMS